ncbi:MAG: M81 family peptidase [Castellaniella sp.]|uniref:M81 family metallopeptidase n=1 Tax=Castellaniella sp. TaxID=1955812 RepID=UPI0012261B8E|nr:M81 family metallopeptidase [Castellaniella sp.]TAN29097.1 MAG: M81 family peptidase [Castellaniella sp.]
MKVLIARMNHETNTFSPVPTPLSSFGNHGPDFGADAYRANKGAPTAMGAFIDLAEGWGAELVTPVSAMANPSGRVDAGAYDAICQSILEAASGCDALLLDLHGAMVVTDIDDGEGELLEQLRQRCLGVPIVVSLDLHGNVTEKMIVNADIVTGFKTYPHLDMYESGRLAGSIFQARREGRATPVTAWRRVPLMSHTLKSATASPAMKGAVDRAKALERRDDIYAVTVMAGFALSDIPAPCVSVIVVGKDHATAQEAADGLARSIWQQREGFIYQSAPLRDSIARAKAISNGADPGPTSGGTPSGPVLLLDHGDNCMSGGTCDTMDVLQEAFAQGLRGIAVGPICDPEAVETLYAAGRGATVTLSLGNKRAIPGRTATPMSLTGRVAALSNGEYTMSGPIYHGMTFCMGRTARLSVDGAEIVVTEQTQEGWDLGIFTCVGLDARRSDFILLKSRMYYQPVFLPLARGYVECDSGGVTSSDYGLFTYTKIKRPVYPFDRDAELGF